MMRQSRRRWQKPAGWGKPQSPDIFSAPAIPTPEPEYPRAPGSKVASGPSVEAARNITDRAKTVRERMLAYFVAAYPSGRTADEASEAVGANILTGQPRLAELHALHVLEQAPERGTNAGGQSAARWRATPLARSQARQAVGADRYAG